MAINKIFSYLSELEHRASGSFTEMPGVSTPLSSPSRPVISAAHSGDGPLDRHSTRGMSDFAPPDPRSIQSCVRSEASPSIPRITSGSARGNEVERGRAVCLPYFV